MGVVFGGVCDVSVFGCVWLCEMRWLLCGDDGSKKTKTTSVIFFIKGPAREFIPITVLINSKKFKPH